jgi:DNA-binding FadR family transcriptional regulator
MTAKRLYERVAHTLANEIMTGAYPLGGRLPSERDLAARFSVSRPTIREALIALEVDGLVDVVTGSGVYVTSHTRKAGTPAPMDIGPFELLEARARVEGEAAALAARHITDETIAELEQLVAEMEEENARDVVMSEDADRRFHVTIARATENSAMTYVVESLWDVRSQSLQTVKFLEKVRAEGIKPRIDEHSRIVDALRRRDPDAARQAMRAHLRGVAEMILKATEAEVLERTRAELAETRQRYAFGETL